MMRSVLRLLLLGVFVALCVPAYAVFHLDPVDGYDCAEGMSTDDCFSDPAGTAFSGPTVTACTAKRSRKEACKECAPAYDDNGQWKGYAVCAYVPWSSACYCDNAKTAACTNKASCTYYNI